jgi:hypothetical protein
MTNRFRVSSMLPRRLEELGLSPVVVLRQAGLPMGLFDQEKILVTTEEVFALHRGISELSADPAIGLKLGTEERVERYDPIAIAALYTRSFRDALQRMARYKQHCTCTHARHARLWPPRIAPISCSTPSGVIRRRQACTHCG